MSRKLLSLYIHYPFCKSKCTYCDFYSLIKKEDMDEKYLHALKKEIIHYSQKYRDKYEICSLYIGGGTPSLLSEKNIEWLFDNLRTFFIFNNNIEITIEVNPESLTESLLKTYRDVGINRISVGVQSLNDRILSSINRLANSKMILDKLNLLKKHIQNFSVDLIYGLPYQTLTIFKSDLLTILKYKPKHISLYNLTINEATPIARFYKNSRKIFPDNKIEYKQYKFSSNILKLYGFRRYEISNFAKKNFHSYHNLRYWLQKDYLGLGPSAVSTINSVRWSNVTNVVDYIKKMKIGLPVESYEKISKLKYINEKIMLNLRLQKGIDIIALKNNENIDLLKIKSKEIKIMRKKGLIRLKKNRLYLSIKGIMVSNYIMSRLFL